MTVGPPGGCHGVPCINDMHCCDGHSCNKTMGVCQGRYLNNENCDNNPRENIMVAKLVYLSGEAVL